MALSTLHEDMIRDVPAFAKKIGSTFTANSRESAATINLSNFDNVIINRWSNTSLLAPVMYKNVGVSEPAHTAKFLSGGVWFEIDEKTISPEMFGANPNGLEDCTSPIQAAINYLVPTGGTIEFNPTGRYGISSTVEVKSYRPINLFSRMGEIGNNDNTPPLGGYLFPMNNINGAMIEYTDPTNINVGYDQHSGTIDGLTFFDQAGNPADPLIDQRVYSVTAALKLTNFLNANVRNCSFNRIKGHAIWGEFVIKSNFQNIRIHYCGDTAKPSLYLPGRDVNHYIQGCSFSQFKIEVCMGSYYTYIGPTAITNTFDDFIYESASEAATESTQTFLYIGGPRNFFTNHSINRNAATEVVVIAGNDNEFRGTCASHDYISVYISGRTNVVDVNIYDSQNALGDVAIQELGTDNTITARMYEAGAINCIGVGAKVVNSIIRTGRISNGPTISLTGNSSSAIGNTIFLNALESGKNGIYHSGIGGIISENYINNADIAIDVASSTNIVVSNNSVGISNTELQQGTNTKTANLNSWILTNPTVVSSTGTLTTVSTVCRHTQIGKLVNLQASITITANGTGAGHIIMNLPVPAKTGIRAFNVGINNTNGTQLWAYTDNGTGLQLLIFNLVGSYPGADGSVLQISLSYEAA